MIDGTDNVGEFPLKALSFLLAAPQTIVESRIE